MGSGKSTVCKHIQSKSGDYLAVINLDQITRDMYSKDTGFQKRCFRIFGKDRIMREDGEAIDTTKVGAILFNEMTPSQRGSFLRIVYLKMTWALFRDILSYFVLEGKKLLILEAPILFEKKFLVPFCYPICTIYVEDEEVLMDRLEARNDPNLQKKLDSQMSWEEKVRRSDFAVKNEGTLDEAYEMFAVELISFQI